MDFPRRPHPITRRTVSSFLVSSAAVASLPRIGHAQAKYPERPVRIVVPFGAGGVADISTRIVAEQLGEKYGQRFVIENTPGAGGINAARQALSGGSDGHTLILVTNGTAISVPLFKSLPFDPLKDFAPISSMAFFDCVFVTNAEQPYKTLAEFLKVARDKPGTLNVGTINVGSTQHLSAELLKSTAGINFVHVPFRATPEATVALLRNDVQMVIDFPAPLKGAITDKKATPVAATGPVSAQLFGIPTVDQAGVPGYEVTSWNAVYAPAGVPKEVVEMLNGALREILADPEVKRRGLELGIEMRASSPAEMEARMRADIQKWSKVIDQANIPKL